MAGALCFGGESVVSMNSYTTDLIAEFLRPYLHSLNLDEKVYFHYDLYDGSIDFSNLTKSEYIKFYQCITKAFDCCLMENNSISVDSKDWMMNLWNGEIRLKMQESPLFDANLLDKNC